jgi:hypothetical protein
VPKAVREAFPAAKTTGTHENEANERTLYRDTRARALKDKHVFALQSKADSASDPDAQIKATRDYYKALYERMRQINPSMKDRIDRTERAALRRLDRLQSASPQ